MFLERLKGERKLRAMGTTRTMVWSPPDKKAEALLVEGWRPYTSLLYAGMHLAGEQRVTATV